MEPIFIVLSVNLERFLSRVTLIIGVASGIGFEIRKRFLAEGDPIALGDINEDQALERSLKARRKLDQGYAGRGATSFNREGNRLYLDGSWAAKPIGQQG